MTSLIKPGALILVFLVVGVAVASLLLSNSKESRTASPSSPVPLADLGVPPIDTAAPANTETATFALG